MKAKLQDGLDIVVINYLQLINGDSKSNGNRVAISYQTSWPLKNTPAGGSDCQGKEFAMSRRIYITLNENKDKNKVILDCLSSSYSESDTIKDVLYRIATNSYNLDLNEADRESEVNLKGDRYTDKCRYCKDVLVIFKKKS